MPVSLRYSSVLGAAVMFCVNLPALLTVVFLFFTWPICGLWGYLAAKRYNEPLIKGA